MSEELDNQQGESKTDPDKLLELQIKQAENEQYELKAMLEDIRLHAKQGESWVKRDVDIHKDNNRTRLKQLTVISTVAAVVILGVLGLIFTLILKGANDDGAEVLKVFISALFGFLGGLGVGRFWQSKSRDN